jgi:hypothetical protein
MELLPVCERAKRNRPVRGERHIRSAKGYIASAPDLRQPVTALGLGGVRRRIEALLMPDDVDVRLVQAPSADRAHMWQRKIRGAETVGDVVDAVNLRGGSDAASFRSSLAKGAFLRAAPVLLRSLDWGGARTGALLGCRLSDVRAELSEFRGCFAGLRPIGPLSQSFHDKLVVEQTQEKPVACGIAVVAIFLGQAP